MYTVGYAWMYGASMMSGSFQVSHPCPPPHKPLFISSALSRALLQVLGLAMFSHIMQMLFLAYVENPHIERTCVAPCICNGVPLSCPHLVTIVVPSQPHFSNVTHAAATV